MPVLIGGSDVRSIRRGSIEVDSVWVGGTQVWNQKPYTPLSGFNDTSGLYVNQAGSYKYSNELTIERDCKLLFTSTAIGYTNTNYAYCRLYKKAVGTSSWHYALLWVGQNSGTTSSIDLVAGDKIRFGYTAITQAMSNWTTTMVERFISSSVGDKTHQTNIEGEHNFRTSTSSGGPPSGVCFTSDSLVMLSDLTSKRIADMQVGDRVLGDGGVINEVVEVRVHGQEERVIVSINDLKTTESHPVKTSDGWKAVNAEAAMAIHPEMTISPLLLGDNLTRVNAQGVEYAEKVKSITPEMLNVPVYNLNVSGADTPALSGNDTYVVDNVVVHNK